MAVLAFAVADELAPGPAAAAFEWVSEFAAAAAPVCLLPAEVVPLEAAFCAAALPCQIQIDTARTQAAPNHPLTAFARCSSNG